MPADAKIARRAAAHLAWNPITQSRVEVYFQFRVSARDSLGCVCHRCVSCADIMIVERTETFTVLPNRNRRISAPGAGPRREMRREPASS